MSRENQIICNCKQVTLADIVTIKFLTLSRSLCMAWFETSLNTNKSGMAQKWLCRFFSLWNH